MATFDPQFTEGAPNYLGWSKAAPPPMPDESTGIALKTVGNALDSGVEIADNAIKSSIKNDLYKSLDSERQQFTDALTAVRNTGGKGNPADAMASANEQDLMPDQGTPPPVPISNGIQSVQKLQDAYAGNKLSETQYYSKLTAIAKDMRSQWPGYRDYIDSEVSKITGGNPANEYIKSAINDINRNQTDAAKQQDYYEKAIVNSGFDKSIDVLNTFKQDHDITKVQNWLAKNNIVQQRQKDQLTTYSLSSAKNANDQQAAESAASSLADHAGTAFFFNKGIVLDNGSSTLNSADITDRLTKLQADGSLDADQGRVLGQQLLALETRAKFDVMQQMRTTYNKDGRSIYETLGPTKANQIINDRISNLYGEQHKMLTDQNLGLLFSTQNAATDMVNNAALKAANDPSLKSVVLTGAVLNKYMPNMSVGFQQYINGNYKGAGGSAEVGGAAVASDLMKLAKVQVQRAVTQTGGAYASGGGNVMTFKQFQEEQDRAQAMVNAPVQDKVAATKYFLGMKDGLLEKDPQVVDNAIKTFFDPTNRGTLSKYADDYYDPSRKVIVTGRTGLFQDLTNPAISKSVWNRANNGNGTAWEFYKGWANGEAVPALTTIAKTWNQNETQYSLDKQNNSPVPASDHHFYWDNENHQIGLMDIHGQPIDLQNSWRLNPDLFAVRNANVILKGLANVAATEGTDVNAYLFKTMKDAGWAPPSLDQRGASTVSDKIVKAVVHSNTPPPKPKAQGEQ